MKIAVYGSRRQDGHLPEIEAWGAYVCPNPECLKRARKSRALERAFSSLIMDEVWEELEKQMKEVPLDAQ